MEKRLKSQQASVEANKNYLFNLANDHRVVLVATLLPAFVWGWRQAKIKGGLRHGVKQALKYGLLAAFTNIKKQISLR